MIKCILLQTHAAKEAGIERKVEQHPPPQPDDDAHAPVPAHHLPHTVDVHAVKVPYHHPLHTIRVCLLRQNMMQSVLSTAQQTTEQALLVEKVDQDAPPGEDVNAVDEALRHPFHLVSQ